MMVKAQRRVLIGGRLRVPARLMQDTGLWRGDCVYVVVGDMGKRTIYSKPPNNGTARRMTVDEHNNLLLRVGKDNAGQDFDFCIDGDCIVVLPSCPGDWISSDGKTPLMRAARQGDLELVESVLASGVSVNRQDEQGWTALHWAAAHTGKGTDSECQRQAEVVRLLVTNGADPNLGDEGGNTPLMTVAAIGDEVTVRVFLNGGADANHKNHYGRTAWDFAREEEYTEILGLLATHGAERRW